MIGIFRDVGAPKRLSILAEGESLLNDAVAIAAFGLSTLTLLAFNERDGFCGFSDCLKKFRLSCHANT